MTQNNDMPKEALDELICLAQGCGGKTEDEINDFGDTIHQALQKRQVDTIAVKRDVPEGYALVPIEPTEEMINVAYAYKHTRWQRGHTNCELYKAIIKAALADEGEI